MNRLIPTSILLISVISMLQANDPTNVVKKTYTKESGQGVEYAIEEKTYLDGFGELLRKETVYPDFITSEYGDISYRYNAIIEGLVEYNNKNLPGYEYMKFPLDYRDMPMPSTTDPEKNIHQLVKQDLIQKLKDYYQMRYAKFTEDDVKPYIETKYFETSANPVKLIEKEGIDYNTAETTSKESRSWKYVISGDEDWIDDKGFISEVSMAFNSSDLLYWLDQKMEAQGIDEGSGVEKKLILGVTASPYRFIDDNGNEIGIPVPYVLSMSLSDVYGNKLRSAIAWPEFRGYTMEYKIVTENEYDSRNRLIKYQAAKDPNELELPGVNPLISETEIEYNYFNDVVKKSHPDEGTVIHEYDKYGKIIWSASAEDLMYNSDGSIYRNSDGNIIPDSCIVHVYDDMQREVAVYKRSYANRDNDDTGRLLAAHAFYKMDRLREFYPFNAGNAYASGYLSKLNLLESETGEVENTRGRIAAHISFSNNGMNYTASSFSYNDNGQVTHLVRLQSGQSPHHYYYEYDGFGRKIRERFDNGTDRQILEYSYDINGRLKSIRMSTNEERYETQEVMSYEYDELGEKRRDRLGGPEKDAQGNVTGYNAGLLEYTYDLNGRAESISHSSGLFKEDIYYERDETGARIGRGYGNINKTRMEYELEDLSHVIDQELSFDNRGRLTGNFKQVNDVTGTQTSVDMSYAYDLLNRFTSKDEGDVDLDDYKYYENTNRLKKIGASSEIRFVYDKNGNIVLDIQRGMFIKYDWRDLPAEYRFYENLSSSITEITGSLNMKGEYVFGNSLEEDILENKALLSRVIMIYDSGGNRVAKIAVDN